MDGFNPKNVMRYPRLDTVLMVENFARKHSGDYTKKQLWEHLPRKTMYQTYSTIIDYLEYSNKIIFDRRGYLCWIWNPELVKKYMARPHLTWEPDDNEVKAKVRR